MARIRTIKPSFWEDEKISKLSFPCRLFYVGTWNFADDCGVIRGNAALLKSYIFPYDDNLRVSEVQKWIDALVDARMLIPISYKSESYYVVRTFRSHQKFDARYPNYIIPKEVTERLLASSDNTTSTQRVPDGSTPREGEGERDINNLSIISPLGIDPKFGDKILPIEEVKSEILEWHFLWIETIGRNKLIPVEKVKYYLELFFNDLANRGINEKSIKNFKDHFANWLNKEIKGKNKKDEPTEESKPTVYRRRRSSISD